MFGRKKDEEYRVATEPQQEQPVEVEEPTVEIPVIKPSSKTVIGKDVVVVGNFDAKEAIDVYGTVRGNVRSSGELFVAENGSLVGEAAVNSLVVEGVIDGTVLCSDTASFSSKAKMKGNLSTASLKTEDGSVFEGKLNMISKSFFEHSEPQEDASELFSEEQ